MDAQPLTPPARGNKFILGGGGWTQAGWAAPGPQLSPVVLAHVPAHSGRSVLSCLLVSRNETSWLGVFAIRSPPPTPPRGPPAGLFDAALKNEMINQLG